MEALLQLIKPEPRGLFVSIFKPAIALRESLGKKFETQLHNENQNAFGVSISAKRVTLTYK